jgi:hypothetical protein
MKRSIELAVAFAVVLAAPAIAGVPANSGMIDHHHAYRQAHRAVHSEAIPPNAIARVPPAPAAPILFQAVRPYPNGQGDEDGLSRHIDDCNKGCIGGNPG